MREAVVRHILDSFGVAPEYLWERSDSAALRHHADKKWFGILMRVPRSKLGLKGDEIIDVLNVKCSPILIGSMTDGRGILPGYHMNKAHWISILLDGSVPMEKIIFLLDASYDMTLKKVKKKKAPLSGSEAKA